MAINTDKLFRKIFLGLMTLAVMLIFILAMNLFLDVSIYSKTLWGGSLLTYLIINLIIDVSGIQYRLLILVAGIIILATFFLLTLNWPLIPSLLIGLTIMIISGLLYISFLH